MGEQFVYDFSQGDASMKNLLGGKGANLAQMVRLGLPVPPGFIITTEACKAYWKETSGLLDRIWPDVKAAVGRLETSTGKSFGGADPLLVSVRSGAPVSMPGMMETILNLGLNDETVLRLGEAAKNERFAYDSYRRFIQMFGNVVMGIDSGEFEFPLSQLKRRLGFSYDYQIPAEEWKTLIGTFKEIVRRSTGKDFPMDPWEQLRSAIEAVFASWNIPRAMAYRKINKISDELGTAVNVVAMVFGNLGEDCGTGVCFTRNPSHGEKRLYGEFLLNAQGEDVVAGIRTPEPIADLERLMPGVYRELLEIAQRLETHYRDMQDIEFTVERGKLYMLQTRSGKRTARAAVKVAVDMLEEGLIDGKMAVQRVTPEQAEQLLHSQVDPDAVVSVLAKGLPASPGAAAGVVIFDPDEAERRGNAGEKVILVRPETTPDDIHGLFAAQGVLTTHGGMTSHAAVVARGMGKPCVSGCEAVEISLEQKCFRVGNVMVKEGDFLTLDGTRGYVILGEVPMVQPSFDDDFRRLLEEADKSAVMEVWANADTPEDAARARSFGARGIGLCRTEHMFMASERLPVMQRMIVAGDKETRLQELARLQAMQTEDFLGILAAMEGFPVTVRLLDPPLHEFLPKEGELRAEIAALSAEAQEERANLERILAKALSLREANPMLGFRGCRLGIVFPEIYEMQVRAIFDAACELTAAGRRVLPDVMLPLVGTREEMRRLKDMVDTVAREIMDHRRVEVPYHVGTMIEVPRAAMVADQLAEFAEFFSFGTNDLTQTAFGYSRDDAEGKFLADYVRLGIFAENPFHVLDREGVGRLMRIAVEDGRRARPDIKIGICGEHGGNPPSIFFCHELGLRYVSCSPFRVPVARLAAAHAVLQSAR